ncbi:MAG TPA: hypothetical protein VEX86_04330, partial [Longimicrobium sp.]|nr:hypothetical protein [Longimicrobium sp.]
MSTPATQPPLVQIQAATPQRTSFVRLSSVLTGYSTDTLAPAIDPIDLASEYLAAVQQRADAATVSRLFTVYASIDKATGGDLSKQAAPVQQQILADPALGPLARRIIRLWYVSIWYDAEPPSMFEGGTVISMNAYTGGLVWDAAQAHPMGYSELAYGYWASAP